jgi:GDP-L-fucose synthase
MLAPAKTSPSGNWGEILWDQSRPDGTPRKVLDVSKIHALGWRHATSFADGILQTYQDFKATSGTRHTTLS